MKEITMKKQSSTAWMMAGLFGILSLGIFLTPAMSHHSFAMYDQTIDRAMTGVATRFVAQANHAELHFVPLGPDGKPMKDADGKYVTWGAEMGGAAAMATRGVTAKSFAAGTIFSMKINPLRDGSNFGSSRGTIVKCPVDSPPAAGMHCDSLEGSTYHGGDAF
jgi:hypothetical protein